LYLIGWNNYFQKFDGKHLTEEDCDNNSDAANGHFRESEILETDKTNKTMDKEVTNILMINWWTRVNLVQISSA